MSGFFFSLRSSIPRAFDWRWLVLSMLSAGIPTLLVALPLGAILSAELDFSAHTEQLAAALNVDALMAIFARYQASQGAVHASAGLAWLCVLTLAPLLSAMAAARYQVVVPLRTLALIQAGAAGYVRWLWLHLSCFLCLLVAVLIAAAFLGVGFAQSDAAVDAAVAGRWRLAFALLAAMALIGTHYAAEAARAEYVLDPALALPPRAFLRAFMRPGLGRRFALYLTLNIAGLTLAFALLALRHWQSGASGRAIFCSLVLSQLAVATFAFTRIARLFVLADAARVRLAPSTPMDDLAAR